MSGGFKMKDFIAIILLVIFPFVVNAQDDPGLSYKEAITIALENNVQLRQQQNILSGIQANKTASYGSLGPDISAYGQAWQSDGNFFIQQEARVVNTTSKNIYGQISADILIFNGLSQMNTIRREEHNLNSQVMTIERTKQRIINQVTVQFLTVLQDQEQLKIAEENLENQNILLEQITTMFDAGSRAITDKYNQEYLVKNAELLVIRAENTLRNDKAILAQTLLLSPTSDYTVEEPAWDVEDIQISEYPRSDIYDIALNSRDDLSSFEEAEAAADRNITVSRGSYYPRLVGYYGWGSRYTDQTIGRNFTEQFWMDNKSQEFGVQLNIPIYSGMRNRAQVVNARVRYENARLDVENQKIQVQSDVLQAYQNFEDVEKAYQVSLVQYQSAELAFETQRESYELGISSLIELSNANRDFVDARSTLSRAKYALLFQKVLMDFAIGTLTVDQIPN